MGSEYDVSFLCRGRTVKMRLHPPGDSFSDARRHATFFCDTGMLDTIMRYVPHDASVVDVGAHIGALSLWFSCMCGARRIVAIEPNDENYRLLEANIGLNSLSDVIVPVHAAVGSTCGRAGCVRADLTNTGMYMYQQASFGGISMTTLDTLLEQGVISAADVLKVDVEGYESAVVDGGAKFFSCYSPVVVVEVWHPGWHVPGAPDFDTSASHAAFFERMGGLGYEVAARLDIDNYVLVRRREAAYAQS